MRQRSFMLQQKREVFFGASLIYASVCLKLSPTLSCKMAQSTQLNILIDILETVSIISYRTNTFHSMRKIGQHVLMAPGTPVCVGELFEGFISNWSSQEEGDEWELMQSGTAS